jgi:peptide/nickel transport system substrate-binding protein
VKKLSPTQIQFTLKQPYAPFLANTTVGILPKHIWNAVSTDEFIFSQYNIEPIGAGPYKVESIQRNGGGIPTSYTLAPWADYVGGEAFISKIIIHFYPDEKSAVEAYNNGTVESLSSVSPSDASDIASSSPDAHIIVSPLPRIFGVFFNQNQSAILADDAVRQALNTAVDRNEIVRKVLVGYGTPVDSALPVSIVSASSVIKSNPVANIATAKSILEKDGWRLNAAGFYEKKGKLASTTLSFAISTLDSPDLTATAGILKSQWAKIGVLVTVKIFEAGEFNQNIIHNRSYDALLFGESVGNGLDLYAFWHSSQRNAPGLNIAQYVNARADALLQDARTTSSTTQQMADYASFDKIIDADNPAVFLYSPDFVYIVPNKIKNVSIGQITSPSDRWDGISKWYIDTDSIWKFFIQRN